MFTTFEAHTQHSPGQTNESFVRDIALNKTKVESSFALILIENSSWISYTQNGNMGDFDMNAKHSTGVRIYRIVSPIAFAVLQSCTFQ